MMKLSKVTLILIVFAYATSCNATSDKPAIHDTVYVEKKPDTTFVEPKITIPKDAVEGDFNGDGTKKFVWLVSPKLKADEADCECDCDCYLKFSNPVIPDLKVQQCIGGTPVNHGDLNDDKGEELA